MRFVLNTGTAEYYTDEYADVGAIQLSFVNAYLIHAKTAKDEPVLINPAAVVTVAEARP